MICNVGLISGVQQSDSVIHILESTLFQILFLYKVEDIDFPVLYSRSLWLSVLQLCKYCIATSDSLKVTHTTKILSYFSCNTETTQRWGLTVQVWKSWLCQF